MPQHKISAAPPIDILFSTQISVTLFSSAVLVVSTQEIIFLKYKYLSKLFARFNKTVSSISPTIVHKTLCRLLLFNALLAF